MLVHEELTGKIVGAAIEVHRELGPGLLESAYETSLCHELTQQSIPFQRQMDLPLNYKGVALDCGYRIDIMVADLVILELKSVEHVLPVHEAQLLTYLKLTRKKIGFILNFHSATMKEGITRRIL